MAERELSRAPSLAALFARAGASAIPGATRLPFVGGRDEAIPDLTLALPRIELRRDRLAAYHRVCRCAPGDQLPPAYPHVLAFPLHLALMTDRRFPFPALGLVHIANRIVQHRPIDAGELLSLRVWATPAQPHPRGRQFSVRTEVRAGDEVVWEEAAVNLRRGGDGGDSPADAAVNPPSSQGLAATATWACRDDLGRRYGAVSGDLNPVHLHPLTARRFGFGRAIAHGMWTQARCLAALGPELPAAFTVQVAFRRPILLPATVHFVESAARPGIAFGVRDADRGTPHLDGLVSF